MDLPVFLLVLFGLAVLYLVKLMSRRPRNFPPGPARIPILGNAAIARNKGCLFHAAAELVRDYGKVVGFWCGKSRCVMIADYDVLNEIMKNLEASSRPNIYPFNECKLGHDASYLKGTNGAPGVLLSNGAAWTEQRRFVMSKLRDFGFGRESMDGSLRAEVRKLVNFFEDKSLTGNAVDMSSTLNISVINALWTIMVGESFALDDERVAHLFSLSDRFMRETSPQPPIAMIIPFNFLIKMPVFRSVTGWSIAKNMFGTLESLMGQYLRPHKETHDASAPPRDLMDAMLTKVQQTSDPASPFHRSHGDATIVNLFIDFFSAGNETISSTLLWTFVYILHNPDVQRKVHEELDSVVGRDRLPCLKDREGLNYLQAVIEESMRITGYVFLSFPHQTTSDVAMSNGYVIPKDTTVLPNLYHVMNDPEYWHEPRTFNPDRFLDPSTGKFKTDPRSVAFNVGKRYCPGKALAHLELFLFLGGLMQKFLVKPEPGKELPKFGEGDLAPQGSLRSPPKYKVVLEARF